MHYGKNKNIAFNKSEEVCIILPKDSKELMEKTDQKNSSYQSNSLKQTCDLSLAIS